MRFRHRCCHCSGCRTCGYAAWFWTSLISPTDAEFAELPSGTVEALLADAPKLTEILTFHVVPGSAFAADLVGTPNATIVHGTDVVFDISPGDKVNDTTVTQADIQTPNGVIHIIGTVLIPGLKLPFCMSIAGF